MLWLLLVHLSFPPSQLIDAARAGDADRVRALLSDGAHVDSRDGEGRTALMVAAGREDTAVVRLLLEAGADVSLRDEAGISALTAAKSSGASEIVALLRKAGARESLEEQLDEAIRAGELERVDRLIKEGADVDALETADFQTPLMTAIQLRELEILLRLIEAGADPTLEGTGIQTTGENAISFAARQGSPWALRILIDAGARSTDLEKTLFLGCASRSVLSVAIEAGANVNATTARGHTPLICAASAGSEDAVSTLLRAGADAAAASDDRRTALDWAKLRGHDHIVRLLEAASQGRE